jgi:hypothetical protein
MEYRVRGGKKWLNICKENQKKERDGFGSSNLGQEEGYPGLPFLRLLEALEGFC